MAFRSSGFTTSIIEGLPTANDDDVEQVSAKSMVRLPTTHHIVELSLGLLYFYLPPASHRTNRYFHSTTPRHIEASTDTSAPLRELGWTYLVISGATENINEPSHARWVRSSCINSRLSSRYAVPLAVNFMQYGMAHARELMSEPINAELSDDEFNKKAEQHADSPYEAHASTV
jgi:hypothetical protein